jgi:hypothetical protein
MNVSCSFLSTHEASDAQNLTYGDLPDLARFSRNDRGRRSRSTIPTPAIDLEARKKRQSGSEAVFFQVTSVVIACDSIVAVTYLRTPRLLSPLEVRL